MEDSRSKQRLSEFFKVGDSDPVRKREDYMVHLRKERYLSRSKAKRSFLAKLSSNLQFEVAMNHWDKYKYYQFSDTELEYLKSEAERITQEIVDKEDFTQLGELVEKLTTFTLDQGQEGEFELVKILRII